MVLYMYQLHWKNWQRNHTQFLATKIYNRYHGFAYNTLILHFLYSTGTFMGFNLSGNPEYLDVRNKLCGNTEAGFLVYNVTNKFSFGTSSPETCLGTSKIIMVLTYKNMC